MKAKKVSALLVATAMVCGIAGGTTAVHADPEYTIKLCTEQTDGDPIDEGCDKWAELVDEATDGAVKIEVYPNSQLGAKADLIEMALAGQGVCTIADGSYLMDYVSDFGVVMGPFLLCNPYGKCKERERGRSIMSRYDMIKGIIPPIITPMNEDESFNEAEFRNQIERQIEGGVHGIFCYGTNGECYALNTQEKEKILKVAVDQIKGRVPVYAGTGCITTKETVEMSKRAEALGADILSVITPYFAAVSQDELYEHYKTVAEAVKIPIVLYNIPARTGCSIAPETVAKLAEIDNIVGAKDSSGNWDNLKAYIELTRDKDFAVISGNDSLILSALKEGGVGGIAGCANVYPHNMVAIYEKFKAGDLEGAQAAQDAIASFRACFKYGNPNTIVKTAVGLLGYPVGKCRKPFYSMSEEGVAALKAVLEENKRNGMN